MTKIVIAGGTGFLGQCVSERYSNDDLVILTRGKARTANNIRYVTWNGKTIGPWKGYLQGADVLINLNGKSIAESMGAASAHEAPEQRTPPFVKTNPSIQTPKS